MGLLSVKAAYGDGVRGIKRCLNGRIEIDFYR